MFGFKGGLNMEHANEQKKRSDAANDKYQKAHAEALAREKREKEEQKQAI